MSSSALPAMGEGGNDVVIGTAGDGNVTSLPRSGSRAIGEATSMAAPGLPAVASARVPPPPKRAASEARSRCSPPEGESDGSALEGGGARGRSQRRAWWWLACWLLVACGAPKPPPTRPPQLRVVAEPATARVQVDERFVGAARVLAARPATLKTGKHRVTIEAPGYFPHDLEVELAPGVTTVEIKLRAVPR